MTGGADMENTIDTWAEAIASLPDKEFFNIMRLYLGKIKTPYNKQRLSSQLASFLKAPQNMKTILCLLDTFDFEILSAVYFIENLTQENLTQFFSDTYKLPLLYSRMANLQERLLIYSVKNQDDKDVLLINPILLPSLKSMLSIQMLLPHSLVTKKNYEDIFIISPNLLFSFVSCVKNYNFSLKTDGSLKKNSLSVIEEIFPGRSDCIQLLTNAFLNLSLLKEGEKSLEIDYERLAVFAKLSEAYQYALLCAASCSRFSREGLKKEAQLLLDCLVSIPEYGFTRKSLLRLAFMLGTRTDDGSALAQKGRFSQILAAARSKDNFDSFQNADLLDRMIDSAIVFGLIQKAGSDENGQDIFTNGCHDIFSSSQIHNPVKALNIESTFAVSIMPGLNLSQALPLSSFLKIRNFGLVCQFELTRESCAKAFDSGMNAEAIFENLEKYTNYELPQNLKINVLDWFNSFSSILLYKGYLLKVSDDQIRFVENNPKIQKYISEKLAAGLYFLNIPADCDANEFLQESGLTFVGSVKTPSIQREILAFPFLRSGRKFDFGDTEEKQLLRPDDFDSDAFLGSLEEKLSHMDFDKNLKEGLKNRILNRLIISESQLSSEAVRTEVLEADGMDFYGKIHLIEAAEKQGDMLEIQIPNSDGTKGYQTVIGHIEAFVKGPADAVLTIIVEPEKESKQFMVSRITNVRRLHF